MEGVERPHRKFSSISSRGLFWILLSSTVITSVVTAFTFFYDYEQELSKIEQSAEGIELTALDSLGLLLWNYDDVLIRKQVSSFLGHPDIETVKIIENDGKIFYEQGNAMTNLADPIKFSFILKNPTGAKIGELAVFYSKKNIYDRLIGKAVIIFALQGVKTFITSIIILLIFNRLIIVHVKTMATFFHDLFSKDQELFNNETLLPKLSSGKSYDEMTILEDSINDILSRVYEMTRQKNSELERQKESAINSARLASLGEMAAGISHEINNPLTIIKGNLLLLQKISGKDAKTAADPAIVQQKIDKALHNIERMTKIITGLKQFSRDGKLDRSAPHVVDIIIKNVMDLCSERFKNSNVAINYLNESTYDLVACRDVELGQVLINLLNNSFDAALGSPPAWVKLTLYNDEVFLYIDITDSGKGLDKEVADKIMDPFFTTKPVGKGTGLGLSISQRIISDFGGSLYYDALKKNTTFTIKLPLSHADSDDTKIVLSAIS